MDEFISDDIIEPIGLGCSLERFTEWKEILDLVTSLKEKPEELSDSPNRGNSAEKSYERFKYIVDQYKEQPHLLDSHIEEILDEIIYIVRSDDITEFNKHQAFKYMRLITNVRGIKVILQHLPHAASDLEPVLTMLEAQDEKNNLNWETRYCLLLWLSIIVKIPFHMSRLDTYDVDENCTVIQRLYNICKKYTMVGDLCRDACAYLTSQFLTRTDTKDTRLPEYLNWASDVITCENLDWPRFGPMLALAAILKYGKREDLLPHAPKLLKTMMTMNWRSEPYRLCRKLAVKVIQRIGLTFLKARVIAWRYKRGKRILPTDIMEWPTGDHLTTPGNKIKEEDDEEDEDNDVEVPNEIEDIIEELIQGLRDPDITVRWSAAKGLGRIMGRMSRQLGDDVVGYVLDLLNPRESDCAWHGGCLALAELSKRGLLLPSRLPEVVPLLKKALLYDEPQGHTSTGGQIRDAACYLAWTFARAYDSNVFAPFVPDVANSLVVLMCFDREVNIRRAASAAFQEHIGRQGTFPHGIDILTAADYFTVGVRNNAYLNISVYIAQFKEYNTSLIDHLVDRKIEHWDIAIRDLAAKALHNLTEHAPQYMLEIILPTLIQKTNSIDVNVRHGSIISVGEVVYALSHLEELTLGKEMKCAIEDIVRNMRKKQMFRGISGELMKIASCQLIDRCSLAKFVTSSEEVVEDWQELLDECLCHEVGNIRNHAASALLSLCSEYYLVNGTVKTSKTDKIIDKYVEKLKANDETTRLGHALALGSLPAEILDSKVELVVDSLIECAALTEATEKWVQSRRQAIIALNSICCKIGISKDGGMNSCHDHLLKILTCMVEGLLDYTLDDSGDTGAWVREASMTGVQALMQLSSKEAPHLLTENIVERAITRIAQQAVERIDRTRGLAGNVFSSLLHSDPRIPHIPQREELVKIFPEEACKNEINWLSGVETFPKFTQMLSLESYTNAILLGLIVSVGGISESLVTASSNCLFDYLRSQNLAELRRICDIIAFMYESNLHNDRIVLPMLSFLDKLLGSGTIQAVLKDPSSKFALQIFNLTRAALAGKMDKFKLLRSIDVYCQMIQVDGVVCKKSLGRLMILLCHKFGWVRKATATKLYEALMLYPDVQGVSEESLESVLNALSEAEWTTVEQSRPIRNKISELLGIPPPVPVAKT